MGAVVTDTHSLIWYLFEPRLLSESARNAFRNAEIEPGVIHVPTICLVEIRYLIDKRVLTEDVFRELLLRLRDEASAPKPIPLTVDVADALRRVPRAEVPDMPDRIIAASSIQSIW